MKNATLTRVEISRRRLLGAGVMAWLAARNASGNDLPRTAGPYVPTPSVIVEPNSRCGAPTFGIAPMRVDVLPCATI